MTEILILDKIIVIIIFGHNCAALKETIPGTFEVRGDDQSPLVDEVFDLETRSQLSSANKCALSGQH